MKQVLGYLSCCCGSCQKLNLDKEGKNPEGFLLAPTFFGRVSWIGREGENS